MARASGSYPEGRWFDSTRRYQSGRLAQLGEHLPYKQGVTGSSPVAPTKNNRGPVVQLVRMPACHAGGRRFEPVPDRQFLNKMSVRHQATNYIPAHRAEGLCGGYSQVVKTAGCGSVMRGFESHYPPHFFRKKLNSVGVSPSGKATDSDSVMRRFESCYPSQIKAPRRNLRSFVFSTKTQ